MGSDGYRLAAEVGHFPETVLLEVGSGRSTHFLASVGPTVTIDIDHRAEIRQLHRVRAVFGRAERLLTLWRDPEIGYGRQVCFAWLDGHDWPYDDLPPDVLGRQAAEYEAAGLELSKDASQHSHLTITALLAPWVAVGGVVAFDDTWQTDSGFDGKGGAAVPWLLGPRPGRTSGRQFDLWRTQDDTEPWHNGYVAVRRVR